MLPSPVENVVRSAQEAFPKTRWSRVMLIGRENSQRARAALEELCRAYWFPVYAFLRRKGHSTHDAEDLTQELFCRLLEQESLSGVDRAKGRFRNFLLGALKHTLLDQVRKARAGKRRVNYLTSLELKEGEERYLREPDPDLTPEQAYDRRWAAALLQQAFERLRTEFQAAGQAARFKCLKAFLAAEPGRGEYEDLAQELGMTARALAGAVYRLRQRYRQLVRMEVAQTVATSEETDAEMRELFGGLREAEGD